MKRNKRMLIAAALCLALMPGTWAEPVEETAAPESTPVVTAAPAPIPAASEVPDETKTPADTESPANTEKPAGTEQPTETEQPAETEQPTVTDAPAETEVPAKTEQPAGTEEPAVTETPAVPDATPKPGETPGITPVPGIPSECPIIALSGATVLEDGSAKLEMAAPDQKIEFTWTYAAEAVEYDVRIEQGQGTVVLNQKTAETRIEWTSAQIQSGRYTIYVGAVQQDGIVLWGNLSFEIAFGRTFPEMGGRPGGFGGFGGFGGQGFGGLGGSEFSEEQQGFRVTPGEALTNSHASGNRDMTLYGAISPEPQQESMLVLTMDEQELGVTLDDGASAFTASVSEGKLLLTPEANGEAWQLNGLALRTLNRSGVETVRLAIGGQSMEMDTDWEPSDAVCAEWSVQGYVLKDYTLIVTAEEMLVAIGDRTIYRINADGEWTPFEG